ncbi:MAG: hypothetical protein AAB361_01300 [Patescibacteria group bacterium]|mgnify:FL=1
MARIIGIKHRVKKTKEGEAKPTLVAIKDGDKTNVYKLETETDEYDFSKTRFPVEWKKIEPQEEIQWFDKEKNSTGLRRHQCKWETAKEEKDLEGVNPSQIRAVAKKQKIERLIAIPVKFDGLKEGDKVVTIFGGSGYIFAGRLSIEAEKNNAFVYCLSPHELAHRRNQDKEKDHLTLIEIFEENPDLFHLIRPVDRGLIRVAEALSLREAAQGQRKKRQQQVWHSLKGRVFLDEAGNYGDLEGEITDAYDEAQEKDVILQNLWKQEEEAEKGLKKAVQDTLVWKRIFENIEGCGERIAAGIIAPIGDIRRFMAQNGKARLKAFCGAHVLLGGKNGKRPKEKQFPRRRAGEVSNWSPLTRQALYLLGGQFNRRPGTEWGKRVIDYKLSLQKKYPEPVEFEAKENGKTVKKKRYTKGHLLKMALRHSLTKFVEHVYKEWVKLEKENQR